MSVNNLIASVSKPSIPNRANIYNMLHLLKENIQVNHICSANSNETFCFTNIFLDLKVTPTSRLKIIFRIRLNICSFIVKLIKMFSTLMSLRTVVVSIDSDTHRDLETSATDSSALDGDLSFFPVDNRQYILR